MSQEPISLADPMTFWKTYYEAHMEAWSQSMVYLISSQPFSQAMSSYLDNYLTSSASLQKIIDYYMGMWLANVNMPSREDLSRLERRLIDAESEDLHKGIEQMTQRIASLETMLQASLASLQQLENRIEHMQQTIDALQSTPAPPLPSQSEHPAW